MIQQFTRKEIDLWPQQTFGPNRHCSNPFFTCTCSALCLCTFKGCAVIYLHSYVLDFEFSSCDLTSCKNTLVACRFSRDVEVMDSVLNQSIVQFTSCLASYVSILVVISLATKWFAIAVIPITILYIILQVSCTPCTSLPPLFPLCMIFPRPRRWGLGENLLVWFPLISGIVIILCEEGEG